MKLSNSFYEIEISEDPTYRLFSVDNRPYNLICTMEDYGRSSDYRTLSITVSNLDSGNSVNIAVVGGLYSFLIEDCAVLNRHELIVLTQDSVAIFDLQKNELLHKKKVISMGTAFHIYPYKECCVIHGELEIVLINKVGGIIWRFSGRDIFVLPEDKGHLNPFSIDRDYIVVYDWEGNKYTLDENGNEVNEKFLFD